MWTFKLTPFGLAIPEGTDYVPPVFYPPGFRHYSFQRQADKELSIPNGGITFAGDVRLFGMDVRPHAQLPAPMKVVVSRRGSKKERRHLADAEAVEHALTQESRVLTAACGNTLNNWDPAPDLGADILICTKAKKPDGAEVWCAFCIKYIRRFIGEAVRPKPGRGTHIYMRRLPSPGGELELEDVVSIFCVNAERNYEDPDYGYCRECKAPWHNERDEGPHTDWFSTAP